MADLSKLSDQELLAMLGDKGPAQAPQEAAPSVPEDMARVIPGGLAKTGAAMAGLPGDLRELGGAALDWLSNKTGGDPQAGANFKDMANKGFGALLGAVSMEPSLVGKAVPLPGSAEINDAISKPFGGYYKPKTLPGKFTETVATFAPNAIAPGSALAKAARVLGPGLASEGARQAVGEDSKWAPLAAAGGALAGGIGVGAIEGALSKTKPMSMEELGNAKTATYKAASDAGVVIKPEAFQKFASEFGSDFTKGNVVQAEVNKNALAALDILQGEAASGAPISLERADKIRRAINGAVEAAAKNNGDDYRLAKEVKNGLDKFLDGLADAPSDAVSGDASVAVPLLKEARGLAQREFKAKQIQELMDLAENQASTNYSASGYEQALRAQFKNFNAKLIKDPGLAKSFSDAERAAIKKVAQGGPLGNVLRWAGKFSPNGPVQTNMASSLGMGTGGGLGYVLSGGNPVAAGAGAMAGQALTLGTGAAARSGATALTARNARIAEELMRAGPNAANPGATAIPRNVLLSTLLSQASN